MPDEGNRGFQKEKQTGETGRETDTGGSHQEQKKLKKQIQKQQIKRDYAKAKRSEQTVGTATKGTIDYIKKIGGKVTNFFKENRKVYISVAVLIGLMFLIITNVTSCSAVFLQNVITYTGTSYLSSDQAIREAELYYTQLEANLQERINNMESEEPGHEEYRYNIGPIEHDPFILISYLSAKYEEFTFEQVKPELDALFALQYRLETEAVNETVTETATVRVGESLGQVVTSGYCNCPICCGIWSGGPTASGAYPTANHTLAVDASNPFVPMGTKVVMNGVEYTVEDTGAFARYGVQFDVYYDSHAAASAHGHQTWECYLADDNGSNEVEVTRTRDVDVLNVTLNSGNLMSICQDRLGFFQKELFSAYNDTKGNLQMFATPVDFNWYSSVTSYYGYRIHPISGANQLHNGMDIGAPEGTKVMAGLTGTVTTSAYNDSYGNYVVIKDSKGYELRYAHLSSRSVSAGASVTKGDEIGLVGNTGNSTGSHLHIELLKNGERLNPIFYLETGEGAGFGGNEYTSEAAQRLLNEAARYLGTPYVWGGYSPSGFDCSGFVSYCLTHSGVRNTGRLTAQGLYDICTPVSQSEAQPGDLIFFTGTYDAGVPVTHIGIYVGNGQMIHCGIRCSIRPSTLHTGRVISMDSDDGKEKGGVTAVRKGEAMKSLEKATADYEKAKEKMEASKARYEADLKRFKAAEIAKTEAENLEIVKIIRAMDMSIPELEAFKKRMKNELPGRVEIQKEETKADDESGKNETERREQLLKAEVKKELACCNDISLPDNTFAPDTDCLCS